MKNLSKIEVAMAADKKADALLCSVGLKNAKKITIAVRRLLLAEEQRRKGLR